MRAEGVKWHFGILSAAGVGHVQPLMALAQELVARGHRVTFFAKPKMEARVREAGLDFVPTGAGTASAQKCVPCNGAGVLKETALIRSEVARFQDEIREHLTQGPDAIRRAGVTALVVDEIAVTGPTIAQLLGLPYFIVSTSVPHRFGWRSWFRLKEVRRLRSWLAWTRSTLLEQSAFRVRGPIRRTLDDFRKAAGFGSVRRLQRDFPCLAHIAQMPKCLDFQRRKLPGDFYYSGPFIYRPKEGSAAFPWKKLDGRPILYASLGTTRNANQAIFRMLAEACQELNVQLVIGLGGRFTPDLLGDLPGNPLVARFAPQTQLLKVACAVITHGGANTVFEALMEGKPMIVIPLAFDQPAVAARLQLLGVAEVLPAARLATARVRGAIERILHEPAFGEAARKIQAEMRQIRGVEFAADILERRLLEFPRVQEAQPGSKWRIAGTSSILKTPAESDLAH